MKIVKKQNSTIWNDFFFNIYVLSSNMWTCADLKSLSTDETQKCEVFRNRQLNFVLLPIIASSMFCQSTNLLKPPFSLSYPLLLYTNFLCKTYLSLKLILHNRLIVEYNTAHNTERVKVNWVIFMLTAILSIALKFLLDRSCLFEGIIDRSKKLFFLTTYQF